MLAGSLASAPNHQAVGIEKASADRSWPAGPPEPRLISRAHRTRSLVCQKWDQAEQPRVVQQVFFQQTRRWTTLLSF